MLDFLSVSNYASYKEEIQKLGPLSQINIVFGNNGSGKTSLSRLLATSDSEISSGCQLSWKQDSKLKPYVYNIDYVRRNFLQNSQIPGVFTLGSENVLLKKQIEELDNQISSSNEELSKLRAELEGDDLLNKQSANAELENARDKITEFCWKNIKVKYDSDFKIVFDGKRRKKDDFLSLCLSELSYWAGKVPPSIDLEALKIRSQTLANNNLEARVLLSLFEVKALRVYEEDSFFEKIIIGKKDVDVAELIDSLGNSDWVHNGLSYLSESHGICPFCQQPLSGSLKVALNQYFDDSYNQNIEAIKRLQMNYEHKAELLLQQIRNYCKVCCELKENVKFCNLGKALVGIIEDNKGKMRCKILEPSRKIKLTGSYDVLVNILDCIKAQNEKIEQHNKLIADRVKQIEIVKKDFWSMICAQYGQIIEELRYNYERAKKKVEGLSKAINLKESELKAYNKKRTDLMSTYTNALPTINAINKQLLQLGFNTFCLMEEAGEYTIVRPDGTKAVDTLSEGERTLVTFLYFKEQIYGENSDKQLKDERLVVIDDPVSSLDAEVLFVVSSLVQEIMRDVLTGHSQLKQIVVLSHNIYFQNEMSFFFNEKRVKEATSFFLISRTKGGSKIERCARNPVRSSYQLLWKELKRNDKDDLSLQNVMRRILEYYFKILGRTSLNLLYKEFPAEERPICKSLISWVNDGSHYSGDDLYYTIPGASVELYHEVFRKVFVNTGNEAHYEMMMRSIECNESKERDVDGSKV